MQWLLHVILMKWHLKITKCYLIITVISLDFVSVLLHWFYVFQTSHAKVVFSEHSETPAHTSWSTVITLSMQSFLPPGLYLIRPWFSPSFTLNSCCHCAAWIALLTDVYQNERIWSIWLKEVLRNTLSCWELDSYHSHICLLNMNTQQLISLA